MRRLAHSLAVALVLTLAASAVEVLTPVASPLVAAAEAFAQAWAHGCGALERDMTLMSDVLRRAGDAYEVDEQRTRAALRTWLSVGGPVDGLEGL